MGNKALGKKRNFDNNPPPDTALPSASPSREGHWNSRFEKNAKSGFFNRIISTVSSIGKHLTFKSSKSPSGGGSKESILSTDKGGGTRGSDARNIKSKTKSSRKASFELPPPPGVTPLESKKTVVQIYPKRTKNQEENSRSSWISRKPTTRIVSETKMISPNEISTVYSEADPCIEIPTPTPTDPCIEIPSKTPTVPCIETNYPSTKIHHVNKSEKALLDKLHVMLNSTPNLTKSDLLKTIESHAKSEQSPISTTLLQFIKENQTGVKNIPSIFNVETALLSKNKPLPGPGPGAVGPKLPSPLPGTVAPKSPSSGPGKDAPKFPSSAPGKAAPKLPPPSGKAPLDTNRKDSSSTGTTSTSSSRSTGTTSTSTSSSLTKGKSKSNQKKRSRSKSKDRKKKSNGKGKVSNPNRAQGKVLAGISFSNEKVHVDGTIVMKQVKKKAGADEFYLVFD